MTSLDSQPMLPFPTTDPFVVEVVRSARRKRSVSASMTGGVLKVSVPNWMSRAEEKNAVDEMVRRFKRRLATRDVDLMQRSRVLAAAHGLKLPNSIEWGDNLTSVWGLCTPSTGEVRISSRLVGAPSWVLDYVIVHELAHLDVDGHNAGFWAIVHRYPRAERAIGYLIAKAEDDRGSDDRESDDRGSYDRGSDCE